VNIPVGEDIESFGVDEDVRWVLIVEKEAVFQTLCRIGVANHADMPGRGIMITVSLGCGSCSTGTQELTLSSFV
jgi:DNA topoisomerase VI subunit A